MVPHDARPVLGAWHRVTDTHRGEAAQQCRGATQPRQNTRGSRTGGVPLLLPVRHQRFENANRRVVPEGACGPPQDAVR